MEQFVNKVAESGIVSRDLVSFLPKNEIAGFDLKPFLFREMILKEKDYRATLQTFDWEQYKNKFVAVYCSADAIIQVWGYMLAVTYLQKAAADVYFGKEEDMQKHIVLKNIAEVNAADYTDKRVVIKGCGDTFIPEYAYVAITQHLMPVVKSLMYGEPCSTVPLYKKR